MAANGAVPFNVLSKTTSTALESTTADTLAEGLADPERVNDALGVANELCD